MHLVSIVIPCYNAGRLLHEAVNSALAQTYPHVEVVIVDDGSTDPETREILRTATWPRTRIFHQENAGPAAARNRAISHAAGAFILPLDADDRIDPTYVEKALAVIEERPEVGVVYCRAIKFGAESGPWQLPPYNLRELVIDNVVFVTALYRKSDWEAVGGYSEGMLSGVEDYEFWIKMLNHGVEIVQLDEFLFHYRVQERSRTTGFQADRSVVVSTYANIFRNNSEFYLKHAEVIFEHRFGLYDELIRYRARYGALDAYLASRPRLERFVAACWRGLRKIAGKCRRAFV